MSEPSIDTIHRAKTGKVSDKWESYLRYYDAAFLPLRDQPISLLEIGVQNGGSLETWADYFTRGVDFVGCDIDPRSGALSFGDERIKVVVGDVKNPTTFQAIQDIAPEFDIIIDDGSHQSQDIIETFADYFSLVKPGGLYIVEDMHTLYWPPWGGGLHNPRSALGLFKALIDIVNFEFWPNQSSIEAYLAPFFPGDSTPWFISEGWIQSIEFRNSLITLRKATQEGHNKLGPRLIIGTEAFFKIEG
jgi:SAM-dependent methyltransferase